MKVNGLMPGMLTCAMSSQAAASRAAPEQVNIGYQKANIVALLKYRGMLDAALKKEEIAVRWVKFPTGPQMLEGLNVGSIDLAATSDAPTAFTQSAKADLVYLGYSPADPKTEATVVPSSSAIHNVKDLKGKCVALNKGADVNYLLIAAFQKGAVDTAVI